MGFYCNNGASYNFMPSYMLRFDGTSLEEVEEINFGSCQTGTTKSRELVCKKRRHRNQMRKRNFFALHSFASELVTWRECNKFKTSRDTWMNILCNHMGGNLSCV